MYFIDTHCHLHDPEFFTPEKQAKILKACKTANVQKLICIGTSHEDSLKAQKFASEHENVFWAYGIHPSELYNSERVPILNQFGQGPFTTIKPIAIGEVGLEYHYYKDRHSEQIKLFEEMIDLALQNDLPLVFHIREAFDDFFSVIDNFHGIKGVVHSFSDNKKNLRKCLDRDLYIGVNGMATYSTLPLPPLERTLLETDAPFLAPVPHRGEQNHPGFIPDIARWLAEKHSTNLETIAEITTKNAETLFGI